MKKRVTLMIKSGRHAGKKYGLTGLQECVIGRADDCTIRLTGSLEFCTVSRHHCAVEVDPDAVRIRDLGSSNGTQINGMQIGRPRHWHLPAEILATPPREVEVHDGDELQVGDTLFAVAIAGPAEDKSRWETDTPPAEGLFAACAGCAHGLAVQDLLEHA